MLEVSTLKINRYRLLSQLNIPQAVFDYLPHLLLKMTSSMNCSYLYHVTVVLK